MQHYERQGYFFNEEIINYYIDLGKKDCSIAKKFRASKLQKKELTIKQKWTVHFFYIFYRLFVQIIVLCLHTETTTIGSLLYILNIFFLIACLQTFWNSLKLSNFLLSITFKSVDLTKSFASDFSSLLITLNCVNLDFTNKLFLNWIISNSY